MNTLAFSTELPAERAGSKARIVWGDTPTTAGVSVSVIEKVIKSVSA
ncbi:hypothetical protein [Hymenobacter segetis]|uniref:Uncharacterized protein n=1 Tax=Hymenobacter segetis TaxID=2025509 RepID=A0ABU9M1V3_9BACT